MHKLLLNIFEDTRGLNSNFDPPPCVINFILKEPTFKKKIKLSTELMSQTSNALRKNQSNVEVFVTINTKSITKNWLVSPRFVCQIRFRYPLRKS